jgi:hypothetical protein
MQVSGFEHGSRYGVLEGDIQRGFGVYLTTFDIGRYHRMKH